LSATPWFAETDGRDKNIYLSLSALLAVITAILQVVLDYRTRWKAHEEAIGGYAMLNRKISQLRTAEQITYDNLTKVRREFNRLTETVPTASWLFWNRPKAISTAITEWERQPTKCDALSN
jgi:hypothetical protein